MVLTEFDKQVLPLCEVKWHQRIINHAKTIFDETGNDSESLNEFLIECNTNIINPADSKVIWNGEIQKFGGDEYGYIWFFNSKIIDKSIKMAIRLDGLERTVYVGNIGFPKNKEERKLRKHLNNKESETDLK